MEKESKPKASRASCAYYPAYYELADASALQALLRGEANEDQQKRALQWIIEQAAGKDEFQFYPTDRETAFSLGRCFVGQQIVKLLKINTAAFVKRN